MVPDLKTVLRWRTAAKAWLRLGGLMTLPAGLFFLAGWLIEGISDGDLWSWRYYFWRMLSGGLFTWWGVMGLAVPGLLVRFLLPLPRAAWPPRCPYCRHELVSLAERRCPECGNALTEEFVEASRNKPGGVA